MNSGSEKKLSMDELMAMNRPAQTAQATPQPIVHLYEAHPTKEEWEAMMDCLYSLSCHAERQAGYLKKVSELLTQLPPRTQMDELLKVAKHLEQMSEQAGKSKEKRFSLPSIRLPGLRLPHLDGPTWVVLLMALAVLFLLWWRLGGVWSNLNHLLQ